MLKSFLDRMDSGFHDTNKWKENIKDVERDWQNRIMALSFSFFLFRSRDMSIVNHCLKTTRNGNFYWFSDFQVWLLGY